MPHDSLSRKHFLKMAGVAGGATLFGAGPLRAGTSDNDTDEPEVKDRSVSGWQEKPVAAPLIIDANAGLGRFADGLNSDLAQTEKAMAYLHAAGISRALAYSVLARQTDAPEGNRMVLDAARSRSDLIPSCVVTPYEMETGQLIDGMNRNRIRIARLFPDSGHFSVDPAIIGGLAGQLEQAGKILFIDFESLDWNGRAIDYAAVARLCKAFPNLNVVLIGSTITGSRNTPHMMRECPNLHLEISQIFQPGGVAKLVEQGYGKRLLFGSGFPQREPGALLNMLAHSGISNDQMADICSGNLLRLLGSSPSGGGIALPKPARRRMIDMHVHQGTYQSFIGLETPEQTVRNMESYGVERVIASSLWSCFGEVTRGNRAVAAGAERFPGRYYGYLTVDPKHPDEVRGEIDRYGGHPGFCGFKLHLMLHQLPVDDPRNEPIFSFANRKGWPLLIHDTGGPDAWREVCNRWPDAHFIKAHIGGSDPRFDSESSGFATLAAETANFYLDCGFSRIFPGAIDRLAAIAGAEKLLFGSDYPMFEFSFQAGRITASALSDEEQGLILGGNAARLLGW